MTSVFPFSTSLRGTGSRILNDGNNVPIPASKEKVLRITCEQIYQLLFAVSDSLSEERLQQICTVVLHRCEDAIGKTSINIKSTKSTPGLPRRVLSMSLQAAISQRMANVVEKGVVKNRMCVGSAKSARNLFATLPNDDGQYDIFLNICDSELMTNHEKTRQNYITFKRSDSNVPLMIFAYLGGAFFVFTGFVWSKDMNVYRHYPTAILSIIFAFLAGICLSWITLNRVIFLSFQYNIVYLQRYHKYVMNLYNSPYGQWLDNGVVLLAALSTGFYLVNIVLMELYDPDMVVAIGRNNHHACDSFTGPPPESFLVTMLCIVMFQFVARGVSRIAVVCSWVTCIVAINVTIYLSDSDSYAWMNLLQFLILWFSYELERLSLRQYLKTLKVIEAGEMAAKLRLRLAAYRTVQASDALEAKCSMVRCYAISY